ncbi:MAG: hypothetical protein SVM86_04150, partial [Candidatus Cloacimonadota bacterium]|nr:hypothetical protein [Candidatus Cloacimonadota bacterium]
GKMEVCIFEDCHTDSCLRIKGLFVIPFQKRNKGKNFMIYHNIFRATNLFKIMIILLLGGSFISDNIKNTDSRKDLKEGFFQVTGGKV